MKLNTSNVEPGLLSSVLKYSFFEIGKYDADSERYPRSPPKRPHHWIAAKSFSSSVLRHKRVNSIPWVRKAISQAHRGILASPPNLRRLLIRIAHCRYTWLGSHGKPQDVYDHPIGPRVFELTYMELVKLEADKRPFPTQPHDYRQYYSPVDSVRRDMPQELKFWDEAVPEWFEADLAKQAAKKAAEALEAGRMEIDG